MANQQFLSNRWQVRIRYRVEAGRHALTLGTIGGRLGQPQLFAKRWQHGVSAGILQRGDQRRQQVAKLRVVHGRVT